MSDPADLGPRSPTDPERVLPKAGLRGALDDANGLELQRVIDAHLAKEPGHLAIFEELYESTRRRAGSRP